MSDEALASEKNEAYRNAIVRCPALAVLRKQYLGRVAHSGFEGWQHALQKYL